MKYNLNKLALLALITGLFLTFHASAQNINIIGPAGSGDFGNLVFVLPNGNIVLCDPYYSIPAGASQVGAVYLYNGATGAPISTVTGTTANDRIGSGGVAVLKNGNYVVSSLLWDNAGIVDAGAVTFGNKTSGISGIISAANSLVGSTASDSVGSSGVTALSNGNYVVGSALWDDGASFNAGAATFGNGTSGVSGTISIANSLVGTTACGVSSAGIAALANGNYVVRSPNWNDGVIGGLGAATFGSGTSGIAGIVSASNSLVGLTANDHVGLSMTALSNGNYVISSPDWNNGGRIDAGAATFGSGTIGISGAVSPANSLVGGASFDVVSYNGITALANGSYVVRSAYCDNGAIEDAGAVTFGNGTNGVAGTVSPANSLVGSTLNDHTGIDKVTALSNGSYVVNSPNWNNGAIADAGAATFGDGTTGVSGAISAANSLVGSNVSDYVSREGTVALANGNYVVLSSMWNNGAITDAGAATFGNGTTGIAGTISTANSLVGESSNDAVGNNGAVALANGNYVVISKNWNNGALFDVGAATFGNGTTGITGTISAANSLVGSKLNDNVGSGVRALSNGNYVVVSGTWDNGAIRDAGAATFGNGITGVSGTISPSNSLVGSTAFEYVGVVTALSNGNYVVSTSQWDNGAATDAGAVTFGNGASGIVGTITPVNSLVGSMASDWVGTDGVEATSNGNYIVRSPQWDNGATVNAGAITRGNGTFGTTGTINSGNSVTGAAANYGTSLNYHFDAANNQTVVGRPAENIVTLLRPLIPTAASVSVSGRVTYGKGFSVSRAAVTLTDAQGNRRNAITNGFGYYRFDGVVVGETYVVNVSAKGRQFDAQVVYITEDVEDLNFTGQ